MLLGCIHSEHATEPQYSLEILGDIIEEVAPDRILIEASEDWYRDGAYVEGTLQYLDGSLDRNNETEVAYAHCQSAGIPCLPYDIAGYSEHMTEVDAWEREPRFFERLWEEAESHAPTLLRRVERAQELQNSCRRQGPLTLNSPACDAVTADKHRSFAEAADAVLPIVEFPDEEYFAFFVGYWRERNRAMAKNICEAASAHPDERILVTMGFEHRYILIELLRESCPQASLKEYWELTTTDR